MIRIQDWLGRFPTGEPLLIERAAVLESASAWDDVRPADRLASDQIAALLLRKETTRALEVAERRLVSNPRFRPAEPALGVRLVELAAVAGKPALRRRLQENNTLTL